MSPIRVAEEEATFSWSSATSWVAFPTTFDGATLMTGGPSSPHYPLLVFGGKNTGLKGGTFLKITDGPLPTA